MVYSKNSKNDNHPIVLIRGGGDLASGVALLLFRAGFRIVVTELAVPIMIRRMVSFAQAVYDGFCQVEEIGGKLATSSAEAMQIINEGKVAVLVDPKSEAGRDFNLTCLVDCRMTKVESDQQMDAAPMVIGLGPGFTVGKNCHAVVETKRGEKLGCVYWQGSAEPNTGVPGQFKGIDLDRVLHAPNAGILVAIQNIGDLVEKGTLIATVGGEPVYSKIKGVLRGLIQTGLLVKGGMKIGDVDPRCDVSLCYQVSDKAMAVGKGVLEAINTRIPQYNII